MSFNLTVAATAMSIFNNKNNNNNCEYQQLDYLINSELLKSNRNYKYKFNKKKREISKNSKVSLEEQFKAACDAIQNLPKNGPFQPSNEMLLKFYGYFKQATLGPIITSRPSIFKVVERAKWDAWNSVKNLTKEEAMKGYIDEIKNIIETMPHNEFIQRLIEAIEFYEYVNEENELMINKNEDDLSDSEIENNFKDNDFCEKKIEHFNMLSHDVYKNNFMSIDSSVKQTNLINKRSNLLENISNKNSGSVSNINGFSVNNDIHQSFHNKHDLNDSKSDKDNGNSQINGEFNENYHYNEILYSDDDENFVDTSDFINEQEVLIQNMKKKILSNFKENMSTKLKNTNETLDQEIISLTNGKIEDNLILNKSEHREIQINKFGGEVNNLPHQSTNSAGQIQTMRQSRPSSSHSLSYGASRNMNLNQNNGSGGGGGYPPNENFLNINSDSSKQILLILLRLQQDTNNVITRLGYLEATVMSLQNNLQMSRIENSIQLNNQATSAFSLIPSSQSRTTRNLNGPFTFLYNIFKNVDWKTVSFTVLWPFIIKIIFYFIRKLRFIIKQKRIRK